MLPFKIFILNACRVVINKNDDCNTTYECDNCEIKVGRDKRVARGI